MKKPCTNCGRLTKDTGIRVRYCKECRLDGSVRFVIGCVDALQNILDFEPDHCRGDVSCQLEEIVENATYQAEKALSQ